MPLSNYTDLSNEKVHTPSSIERGPNDIQRGLRSSIAIIWLVIWYVSSGVTLFSNKYILSQFNGDAFSLGTIQLLISVIAGYIQIYLVNRNSASLHRVGSLAQHLCRDLLFIGVCRSITIVLGLFALKYIAVSFVATIKSSSPLFTVVISRIMLGERTNNLAKISMIPITIGLTLCCSFELSFHIVGLMCAFGTNIFECLQNVYSKILISGEHHRYTAIELQFWASFIACFLQFPLTFYYVPVPTALTSTSNYLIILYILNGFAYHIQAVAAYAIMAYISPITHSVANTVKRALLIWLSVVIFHNPVTFLSGLGTMIVIFGVILYNEAREFDKKSSNSVNESSGMQQWRVV